MRKFFVSDHLNIGTSPKPVPDKYNTEKHALQWAKENFQWATVWFSEMPDVLYSTFGYVDNRSK